MTPKERVLAACRHEATDLVPIYHCNTSSRSASLLLGREAHVGGGIQQYREARALWDGEKAHQEFLERTWRDTVDLSKATGADLVRVSYWRMNEKPTAKIDENTFFYGNRDASWRVMRFDPESELYQVIDQHPHPEPTEEQIEQTIVNAEDKLESYHPKLTSYQDIVRGVETIGEEYAIPGTGIGIAIPNRSETWLLMVAMRPDLIKRWLDVRAEYSIRSVIAQSELDVRIMLGGGDFASNHGPNYSPKAFREFMSPNLAKITEACHRHGKLHFFASDGDLWPVADDLFPYVDGFYEIDRRAGMDLRKLRERYPHLTLIGNISSHTLHLGTREEVVHETRSCLDDAKELKGIIVGCSNLICPGTPPENLFAMQETITRYR